MANVGASPSITQPSPCVNDSISSCHWDQKVPSWWLLLLRHLHQQQSPLVQALLLLVLLILNMTNHPCQKLVNALIFAWNMTLWGHSLMSARNWDMCIQIYSGGRQSRGWRNIACKAGCITHLPRPFSYKDPGALHCSIGPAWFSN